MRPIREASLAMMAALLVAPVGCGASPEKKFIGEWVSGPTPIQTFIVFEEDGKAVYGSGNDDQGRFSHNGEWTVSDSNEEQATFRAKFMGTFIVGKVTLVDDDTIKLTVTKEGGPKDANTKICKRVELE